MPSWLDCWCVVWLGGEGRGRRGWINRIGLFFWLLGTWEVGSEEGKEADLAVGEL